MKKIYQVFLTSVALFAFTLAGSATVIVNQTSWPDGDSVLLQTNQDLPDSLGWQTSHRVNLWATNGTMVLSNYNAGTAIYAFFADSNNPISLSVGQMIRATMNIIFTNVVSQATELTDPGARGLRFGLVWTGTNQPPLTNGTGVSLRCEPGYSQNMNFATAFSFDDPLQVLAWTNSFPQVSGYNGLFEKAADNINIPPNGGGRSNDMAFTDGIPYTFFFTVAHSDTNTVDITTTITGSTLTNGFITQTVTDTNYAYTNFDTFGIRPATSTRTAQFFTFTSFKVETLPITAPAPQLTKIQKQGANYVITWNTTPGYSYSVLRTNDLHTLLTNWPPALITAYPIGYATGSSVSYTDTTATATANFYRISSP